MARLTTLGKVLFYQLFIWIFFIVCWVWNLIKFIKCDFAPIDKHEIIHGLGVFLPPSSVITVWF